MFVTLGVLHCPVGLENSPKNCQIPSFGWHYQCQSFLAGHIGALDNVLKHIWRTTKGTTSPFKGNASTLGTPGFIGALGMLIRPRNRPKGMLSFGSAKEDWFPAFCTVALITDTIYLGTFIPFLWKGRTHLLGLFATNEKPLRLINLNSRKQGTQVWLISELF